MRAVDEAGLIKVDLQLTSSTQYPQQISLHPALLHFFLIIAKDNMSRRSDGEIRNLGQDGCSWE